MNYSVLEEGAGRLVTHLFESPYRIEYPYHNLTHTKEVVTRAKEIAAFYLLDEKDDFMLTVAAWFHDTGQLYGEMDGHEEKSAVIMKNYFENSDVSSGLIQAAEGCILATKYGALPGTLPEKIICDADTYHFGTALFHKTEFLTKAEMEIRTGEKFPHWHEESLQLLQNHVFYTEYCQLLLQPGKQKNIAWLESLIQSGEPEDV
jgi:predicted metal-dependent HD superfamily phosphohydrolase